MVDLDAVDSVDSLILDVLRSLRNRLVTSFPVSPGRLTRIYDHWSVAPHGAEFPDYNLMVIYVGGKYSIPVTGNPQDNAPGVNQNAIHSHTWHRNTGAVGIAIDGMDRATTTNFGPDALTQESLIWLCGANAAVAAAYGIDLSGTVTMHATHADNIGGMVDTYGEPTLLTHAECAVIDKYPGERWDLGVLNPLASDVPLTPAMRTASGSSIRALSHRIKLLL